ncbi:hypothetical protein OIE66_05575 [Nonomuraea sp. NBC_01738]|uniref:hypothetical protein n=1 Tax=Nonomuraea sp. NBC_01738 TaxID=2976003 RepID=UPI002E11A9CF|nr:hypothetical protein OIE66_05575 [Nonomuraea sp. NBC_01738]
MLSFGDSFRCVCPGQEVNQGALYKIPLYSLMTTTIATPLVGMAEGAYQAHVEHQRARVRVFAGEKVRDTDDRPLLFYRGGYTVTEPETVPVTWTSRPGDWH